MATLELGLRLVASLLQKKDSASFYDAKLTETYFITEEEKGVYNFVAEHLHKHGVLPAISTVSTAFSTLPDAPEPPSFYLEEIEARHGHRLFNTTLKECGDLIKAKDIDGITKAFDTALSTFRGLTNRQNVMDFGKESHDVFKYLHSKNYSLDYNIYTGWPTLDKIMNGMGAGDVCSIIGRPAAGKAQPLDARVLTSKGFIPMGEVTVGTSMASIDGAESIVTGVYPQGIKQTYTIKFVDGRTTECCGEHLWEVYSRHWTEKYKIINTIELITLIKSKRHQGRLAVRMFSGNFGEDTNLPMDAYLLGALIGDGGFTGASVMFSTADDEMLDRLNALVKPTHSLVHRSNYDYAITPNGYASNDFKPPRNVLNPFKEALIAMNLWGCKSEAKFIPEAYMSGTKATRLALLQGLMDTDGTTEKNGGVSFSTSSKVLAKQVVDLVRSLGGGCADFKTKKTTHLDSYRIHIKFNNPQDSFRLTRKKARLPTSNQRTGSIRSVIDTITLSREVECQCISVSHPSKLYVTDDYVVTHNTFLGLWVAFNVYLVQKKDVIFVSMEMSKPVLTQRMSALITKAKLSEVMTGQLSTKKLHSILDTLTGLADLPQKMYFVDGALSSTVPQVEAFIHQYKPALVVIDGAYLLQHANPRISKAERVGENIRALKQLAEKYKIPMLLSYQFNREAAKKGKKGEAAGLEDIGSSDEIGQISSVVLSLKQPESAETLKQRNITVIKGRHGGEHTEIAINWDFDKLNFAEVGTESEDDEDDSYKDTHTIDDDDFID